MSLVAVVLNERLSPETNVGPALRIVSMEIRPMLSFQQADRRTFLQVGGLTLGGLSLADLLRVRTEAAGSVNPLTGKSVVFLFMHGGPSQTETFDPKMTAPDGVRSVTGEVSTAIPGVTFGATFTRLASLADKLAVVRSFVTGDGRHDIKPIVCKDTGGANIGSIYARVAGANRIDNGLPTNVALFPRSVDPETMPRVKQFGDFTATGSLGSAYAPFVPGAGGEMQENMTLRLPMNRLDDRRLLLSRLDRVRWAMEAAGTWDGLDRIREQAFSTILGGAAKAFDLSQEDPRLVERYDTSRLVRPEQIDTRWNNHKRYADNGRTLGKLLLLARRLCEAGCGFVTVTTNFVWDMHADANNAGVEEGMGYMGVPFDHAVSAFIEDVEARGLSDRILLVCCGEMGRTPKVNKRGGRDHWGGLASLLLYGGGLKMGQVIGRSSRDAGQPASDPVTIPHLVATVMHTLFDVGQLRLARQVPNDVMRVATSGEPIRELV